MLREQNFFRQWNVLYLQASVEMIGVEIDLKGIPKSVFTGHQ